jgi:hypothetical protein
MWLLGVPVTCPAQPLLVPRTAAPIRIDGALDDAGWQRAARLDRFYEFSPGDNVQPKVRTVAYLTYDERYFYVGVACQDPHPERIRAPFVDRDSVLGDQDNIAVQLDTRNDGRTALELRANPRGIQTDAFLNDASATDGEDFSPDYFYDTAARITRTGWTVEFRIPLSTLRYSNARPQVWGILIWRNYPREYRYQIGSSPIPRGSPCFQCHELKIVLRDLPGSRHVVAAPYVTADENGVPRADGALHNGPVQGDGGVDVKATLNADSVFDATVNPDFSQVEADVGQLTVNSRFAPLYPEKRPFFLEQIDLFQTPIQAVHTRSITSPQWGARSTGAFAATTYTLLVAEDRGGGSVILPGPSESSLAPQDFRSLVAIGRLRHDFGQSFGGLLVTERQTPGGHNLVAGPDFQWRHGPTDQLTGQWLTSDSREMNRPDLSAAWTGQHLASHAAYASWLHSERTIDWTVGYTDVGQGFRADVGFVPQVGYRSVNVDLGYKFFPKGLVSFVRPAITGVYTVEPGGAVVSRSLYPNINAQGRWASAATLELHPHESTRVLDAVFVTNFAKFSLQMRPSAWLPLFTISGRLGGDVDVVNVRPGSGGDVTVSATFRPTHHLDLAFNGERQWLDVTRGEATSGRLFTAQITRVKATYTFTARSLLRVIGQYEKVAHAPSLYLLPVAAREGSFSGSALYAYKLNWQTVLFAGYGDDRVLSETSRLVPTARRYFVKVSYAFQR